jgi:hypothetical protein
MKPTRQLIVTTLTFIFVLTLNVYAQERKTKKVIKKQKTEIIKKNKKTEQVRPAKGERPTDVKKFSSKTLKSGSKGTPAKPKQESLNQVNGVGTKKAVVQFQKKKKLDSDGIVGPKTISEANKKKVRAKKKPNQKKKKQLKKKQ